MSQSKLINRISSGVLLVTIAGVALLFTVTRTTDAASTQDFRAGNIIDDGVFYNKNAMSAAQIQDFLNRLIPNCDTWGTEPSEYGGGTRAEYAASRGLHPPPYVCLNNYHENPTTGETSFEKGGGAFAGGISAAQIIYNASQQYGINPQVLLVLLKKESAGPLTSDTWPLKSQYKYAMGYACPDSGPDNSANCDDSKAGFYKQMMLAAWQLKYYRDHPNDYRYSIGWNDIQYSPDPSCGTKSVNIENMATLSLYIYTPYTPNDAALANYPGTAPCGAYGNRNFFMFFSEWFGSTTGNRWEPLLDPRVMVTNKNTVKVNPDTNTPLQSIPSNTQIKFSTKTTLYTFNGDGCLRTQFDTDRNVNACINYKDVSNFTPTISSINVDNSPILKQVSQWTCKVNFKTLDATDQCFIAGTQISFKEKTTVAGQEYLITEHDSINQNSLGFLPSRLMSAPVVSPLSESEMIRVNNAWTCKVDLYSLTVIEDQCFDKGTSIKFSKRITIDGVKYLMTEFDDTKRINRAFLESRFPVT